MLSAESILREALTDKILNTGRQMSTNWNNRCTSNYCAAPFKVNHLGASPFSTSLFVEQRGPVWSN